MNRSPQLKFQLNSASDWGVGDPLAVPKIALGMWKPDHRAARIEIVVYHNPRRFLSQCPRFKVVPL